jgi:copper oxidase (laccase) domain-containing protein
MVAQMAALGAEPDGIVACVSPSAGPCCYEVGPEVLKAAVEGIGPHAATFFRATGRALLAGQGRQDRKALFDLWSANRDQLLRAGLRERNIHVAGLCTMCRNDLFPSHRREGDAAGRFAAIVARR